jgi:hypothetical protein
MKRRDQRDGFRTIQRGQPEGVCRRFLWLLPVLLFLPPGCVNTDVLNKAEEKAAKEKPPPVKTIGDISTVANADPVAASGVGLVVGLEGTGGDAPPGGLRAMLENELRRHGGDQKVKELLASPDTSLVLVTAYIPAGAHKYDPLDVEISLPPGSRTTSLRGGVLKECLLYDYSTTKAVDPSYNGPNRGLMGHVIAQASGPVLVGFGDGDPASKLCRGRIWGGGKSRTDRPFILVLNDSQQLSRTTQVVAERINETFHGPVRGALADMAVAKTNQIVWLTVPHQYQLNQPRYLRVVRFIPLENSPRERFGYERRLEEDLIDPAHALSAALRLEALGADSVPILKKGLKSEHVLVRFAAAEALAYLGSPACGEELARLTETQPALRAFCLTAMASLNEAVCHVELRKLLASSKAETRYGAFRALRSLDEHDEAVPGELLGESFWLHHVATDSKPMVHLSSSRRAEIVLFGEDVYLLPPVQFLAGPEFTVTAGRADDRCTVSRFSAHRGSQQRQCSLRLVDVLHTLADLGGQYPDAVELLVQADKCRCVSAPLAIDALPQSTSVQQLAKAGRDDPEIQKTDPELLNAREEFGMTPTLFEKAGDRRRTATEGGEASGDNDRAWKEAERQQPEPVKRVRHTTWSWSE